MLYLQNVPSPGRPSQTDSTPNTADYTSKRGESLKSIGNRFGVPVEQMHKNNPGITNADQAISPGTHISIPVGSGTDQARQHTMQSGEDLTDVAKQAGVSEKSIREVNGLGSGEAVYPGKTLLIPAKSGSGNHAGQAGAPTDPKALVKAYPKLKSYSHEQLQKVIDNIKQLRDGSFREKIEAAANLATDLQPKKLPDLLKQLGVDDKAITKLVTDKGALAAVATLASKDSSSADKIKAALTLADSLGSLAPDKLGQVLKPYLAALPSGQALVDAITAYTDPDASALDKAKATLELAKAIRKSAGDAFPKLADKLRHTESFTKSIGAALTLIDPDASLKDKAEAALQLAANVPELAGDARALGQFLKNNGVEDSEAILKEIDRLPATAHLPEDIKKNLNPEVAKSMTPEQADQLAKMAAEGDMKDELNATLKKIKDPEAFKALMSSLDQAGDNAGKKALLKTLSGLKTGVADELLTSKIGDKPAAKVLAKLVNGLDADQRADLAKLLKDFDTDGLKSFLKISDKVDSKVLGDALKYLGKVDSKTASTVLKGLDKMMGKVGIKLTGEIATKILKGITKIIPIAGAVPAGYDAYQMGKIAADTELPPNIRFMALQASELNGLDAASSIAEPFIAEFFGIPVAADVAIGVAELGLDLIVSDQKAKYEADPDGYKAPDWMNTVNMAMAAGQGPTGIAAFTAIYGPEGAEKAIGSAVRYNGKLGIQATEASQKIAAHITGDGMHYTAEGLHALADMIRHPGKYGAAAKELGKEAVQKLADIAQGTGKLAKAAAKELGNLVDDLKNLGVKGAEALGWIASHPGKAAKKAVGALSSMAQKGIELGTEAGKAAAKAAMEALGTARDALKSAGKVASEALQATEKAIGNVVDSAVKLGKEGIETLGWIATHPGKAAEIAKDALVDVASKAGKLAKDAYDKIIDLGEDGVELAKSVAKNLENAGEKGVEMLKYAVEHPGDAAKEVRKAATQALKNIANGTSEAAKAAVHALTDFVDTGIEEAKETVSELLTEGGKAAEEIAKTWGGELSEGAKEIIGGLKDLGDAGKEALGKLSDAGIGFAADVLDSIGSWVKGTTGKVSPFW